MKQCQHYIIPINKGKPITLMAHAMADKFGFENLLALRGVKSKTFHFESGASVFFPITIHLVEAPKDAIVETAQTIKQAVHVSDRDIGIWLLKIFYRSGLEEIRTAIKETSAMPVTLL